MKIEDFLVLGEDDVRPNVIINAIKREAPAKAAEVCFSLKNGGFVLEEIGKGQPSNASAKNADGHFAEEMSDLSLRRPLNRASTTFGSFLKLKLLVSPAARG